MRIRPGGNSVAQATVSTRCPPTVLSNRSPSQPMSPSDLLLTDARIATMRAGAPDAYGAIEDGALAIRDGEITWVGPAFEPSVARGGGDPVARGDAGSPRR